jgi:nicotinamide riboside kinase
MPDASGGRAVPVRIVVTGPECTGKTTLARALGDALGAPVVPEAARLFAEWHSGPLSAETVEPIARLGVQLEEEARRGAGAAAGTIVRDTDLVSTVVYARHYYGGVEPWIVAEAIARRGDLYLLCTPDLPWVPDGIRDRPAGREALFADFSAELRRIGAAVVEIRGTGLARTTSALDAVRTRGLIAGRGANP